ncbi:MAG: NADH-quinone oxidoreductase subunit C [Actinomycetota bacterium]|nr:NADH-quinone oxidoreductase subunit C [Actinomycetota bacterium]
MTEKPASAEAAAEAELSPTEEPALIFGTISSLSHGQLVIHPDRESYLTVVQALQDDGYQMCVDVTAADYLVHRTRPLPAGVRPERFEVVVSLLSFSPPRRIRVRVQVPQSDPSIPSLYNLYPGVDAMERETYDMYGIVFTGHPDLSRILMPDDWEGHPLQKDYGIGRIPVQFKGAPAPR